MRAAEVEGKLNEAFVSGTTAFADPVLEFRNLWICMLDGPIPEVTALLGETAGTDAETGNPGAARLRDSLPIAGFGEGKEADDTVLTGIPLGSSLEREAAIEDLRSGIFFLSSIDIISLGKEALGFIFRSSMLERSKVPWSKSSSSKALLNLYNFCPSS